MTIFMKDLNRLVNSNNTDDPAQKQDAKATNIIDFKPKWWVIIATYFPGVIAVVTAIALFWQLVLLSAANSISKDNVQKQLRAYAGAIKGEVVGINTIGSLKVRITIRNSGQTPAYQVSIESNVDWRECRPLTGAMPIKKRFHTTLAAGEEVCLEHNDVPPFRKELNAKTKELHAVGNVLYKDIYGTQHESSFHFIQGGEYDPQSPSMGLAESGNESD